ncbi:hypothetical protein LINPERHAP2_LOCUS30423 [Linum perenne]
MSEPSHPDDDTNRAWLWLVEYMASSPEIDCTTLHDLIEEAHELLNQSVRERITLRCLQELFGASHVAAHDPPSGPEAKLAVDFSSSCEDVLESIRRETSDLRKGGPELLKWDIHPFIVHKKASMPKCFLNQLKETITEGPVPSAALFAKVSGLVHENEDEKRSTLEEHGQSEALGRSDCQIEVSRGESVSQPPANGLAAIDENLCFSNPSTSERGEIFGDRGGVSLGSHGRVSAADCQQADTERFERESLSTDMVNDDNLVEHSMQGKVGVAEKENSDLGAESQRGVSKEGPDDSSLLSKDAGDWSGSNLCVICGKNGQLLVCGRDGCSSVVHESCLGSTPSFDSTGQFCCPYCADSIATSYYKKMKERMAVTLKHLSAFLSVGSENPSLEGTGRSDRNGNGKPDRFGDVGPFDENLGMKEGNQTISGRDVDEGNDYQFENGAGRLQHLPVASHGINDKPISEQEPADAACSSRSSGERQTERTTHVCPSVRVPDREQDQDLSDPSHLGDNLLGEKKDIVSEAQDQTEGAITKNVLGEIGVQKQVMSISTVPTFENEAGRLQHVTVAAHSINEKPTSEKDDAICNLRDSGEMQIERITVVCPSVRVPERKQDQDLPVPPCLGDNILGEKTDIVSEEQDLTEGVTKEKVPDKIFVHQVMPISAVPMGGGASDKGHNQPASSNNSVGSRKREREDATSHRTRRKKVPWTAPEENMLKEAVPKFTECGIISWKAIIEYGRSVFFDSRTPEDLRGKWKLMCRKSSK